MAKLWTKNKKKGGFKRRSERRVYGEQVVFVEQRKYCLKIEKKT